MLAVMIKEFRELRRDRRTLGMLIVMPVLLLVIFGYAANFLGDRIETTVVGADAEVVAHDLDAFDTGDVALEETVDTTLGADDVEPLLRDGKADVVVVATDADETAPITDRVEVYVDGSSLFTAQAAQRLFVQITAEDAQDRIAAILENPQAAIAGGAEIDAPSIDPDDLVTVLFNPDLETSWVMIPGLIGLILTMIGTIITSIGLVREREAGTLEQLAVMPLRPGGIILGKIAPYFLLATLDMALITVLGVWLFGVPFVGDFWLFALAVVVFLFVVLGGGVLISSLSNTTGQAIQLALMIVMPQVLLSGIIFPLESMAAGVRWIGYLLPLTWFNMVSNGVLLRGAGIDSLWFPLAVLALEAIVIFGVATARMRRSLTHGGAR